MDEDMDEDVDEDIRNANIVSKQGAAFSENVAAKGCVSCVGISKHFRMIHCDRQIENRQNIAVNRF